MSPTALRWGAVAAAGLATFYVAVLAGASGWSHLADQARTDWWLLVPIVLGFAAQVALTVELRRRHRARHLATTTGAGTGASAVGMVACCAHHLVELAPVLGAAGLAGFLFDWRIPFMLAGIAINAAAVAISARRLAHLEPRDRGMACAA